MICVLIFFLSHLWFGYSITLEKTALKDISCEDITNPHDCYYLFTYSPFGKDCYHCGRFTFHDTNISNSSPSCHKWENYCDALRTCGGNQGRIHVGYKYKHINFLTSPYYISYELGDSRYIYICLLYFTILCVIDPVFGEKMNKYLSILYPFYALVMLLSTFHSLLNLNETIELYCPLAPVPYSSREFFLQLRMRGEIIIEVLIGIKSMVSVAENSWSNWHYFLILWPLFGDVFFSQILSALSLCIFTINFVFQKSSPHYLENRTTLKLVLCIVMFFICFFSIASESLFFYIILLATLYSLYRFQAAWRAIQDEDLKITDEYLKRSRWMLLVWAGLMGVLQLIFMWRYDVVNNPFRDWKVAFRIIHAPFLVALSILHEILPFKTAETVVTMNAIAYGMRAEQHINAWSKSHLIAFLAFSQLFVLSMSTRRGSTIPGWCFNGILTMITHMVAIDIHRHFYSQFPFKASLVVFLNLVMMILLGVTIYCVYNEIWSESSLHQVHTLGFVIKILMGLYGIKPPKNRPPFDNIRQEITLLNEQQMLELRAVIDDHLAREDGYQPVASAGVADHDLNQVY